MQVAGPNQWSSCKDGVQWPVKLHIETGSDAQCMPAAGPATPDGTLHAAIISGLQGDKKCLKERVSRGCHAGALHAGQHEA